MATLELDDIQGLVARGYGQLSAACYLMLQLEDPPAARTWLQTLAERVTPGSERPEEVATHVAFTVDGLRNIGLAEEDLATFSREFWEGMATPNRAQFLGDVGESAPEHWQWGGPNTPVDLTVLLFARDEPRLETEVATLKEEWTGVSEVVRLDTYAFDSPLEHFGFADGIAQPIIEGLSRTGPPENTLAPGEFILGYPNAYDKLPPRPLVQASEGAAALPLTKNQEGVHGQELGRNGTYLVFRELEQDVQGFWTFVSEASEALYGTDDHETRVRVAAKMVGRWPSGAPITLAPEADNLAKATRDNFGYRDGDMAGHGCPLGAHIRRTNPRDALEGTREESVTVSNRHRILRRGRPFGAPVSRALDVDEILDATADHEAVGLHFIGINADIARQFEFIQHTWIINPKFDGLYSDPDPLMGTIDGRNSTFTMQAKPVRKRITGMKRFVEVRGGAYFFLPGLRALKFLANLDGNP